MARQFYLNWSAFVEEAKQRRKAQRLTQARLAVLARVSTPTISRFENGAKDIQLSTIMNILGVLGMVDRRRLLFPQPEAHYQLDRKVVSFKGLDGDKVVPCAITYEALLEHFTKDIQEPLKIFKAHRKRIEQEARRKYIADAIELDGEVLIKSADL